MWSVGILSSWPAGVGWLVGRTLFAARLATAIYSLALALTLGVYAIRTYAPAFRSFALPLSLLGTSLMWKLVPGTPHLVVQAFGEVSGALVLAWGIVLLPRRPRLAAFVLGLCVWHTKFIYAPVAGLMLVFSAARRDEPLAARARFLVTQVAIFLLPLLAWIVLIGVQTGTDGLLVWLHDRQRLSEFHYTASDIPADLSAFAARLASPEVEWSRYASLVKVEIIALLMLPTAWLVREIAARRRQGRRDLALDLLQAGLCAGFLSSAWWYFVLHRFMWLRHVTPFLLIGFGVVLYAAVTRAAGMSEPWRSRLALIVLLAIAVDSVPRWPATARLVASARTTATFPLRCSADPRPAPPRTVQPRDPLAQCWETMRYAPGDPIGLAPDQLRDADEILRDRTIGR